MRTRIKFYKRIKQYVPEYYSGKFLWFEIWLGFKTGRANTDGWPGCDVDILYSFDTLEEAEQFLKTMSPPY